MLLLGWVVIRFFIGGHFTQTAVRDFIPYGYAFVAVIAGNAVVASNSENRARTVRILRLALTFHLAWVALALLVPSLVAALPVLTGPTGSVELLGLRPDFDGALVGVLAAICLVDVFKRRHAFLMIVMYAVCWACIFRLESRAGLLAALVCNAISFFVVFRRREASMNRKGMLVSLFPIVLGVVAFALPYTTSGARLLATLDPSATSARVAHGALGTMGARWHSWQALWQYSTESAGRFLFGVGFGPDFMANSGALQLLVGHMATSTSPRSPHDYLVGSLVRLGLVGVVLLLAIFAVALSKIRTLVADFYEDRLALYAALLVVGLLLTALMGVVLESPFGAVPFFWSYGVLCGGRSLRGGGGTGQAVVGMTRPRAMESTSVGSDGAKVEVRQRDLR